LFSLSNQIASRRFRTALCLALAAWIATISLLPQAGGRRKSGNFDALAIDLPTDEFNLLATPEGARPIALPAIARVTIRIAVEQEPKPSSYKFDRKTRAQCEFVAKCIVVSSLLAHEHLIERPGAPPPRCVC
jgi:hypothetical protein